MELIHRKIGGPGIDYPVYTLEEAEELGLGAVPWREVQKGGWAITDDNYVMQCRSRKAYTNRFGTQDFFNLTAAAVWGSSKKPLSFLERKANRGYGNSTGKRWDERATQERRFYDRVVHHAALMQIATGKYDYEQLARIYRPDHAIHYSIFAIKKIMATARGKQLIREEVEKLMLGAGMTIADWIKLGERTFEKADEKDDVAEMRRIWEKWGEFLNIKEAESKMIPQEATVLNAISEDIKQLPKVENGK